jgi:hypothetical protein
MIDKSDKHQRNGNDRKALHLHDERWIIISLEINTKEIICRNSYIPKKKEECKRKSREGRRKKQLI